MKTNSSCKRWPSPNCENMVPNAKLKTFVSKINGLKGLHESRMGQLWKKHSKIEKHTPPQVPKWKFDPFELGEWEGLLSWNNVQWNVNRSWWIQKNIEHHTKKLG